MQMVLRHTANFTAWLSAFWAQISQQDDGEFVGRWIPNRSRHMYFRAKVFRKDDGWAYQVESRTGWFGVPYQYDTHKPSDNVCSERRKAIEAAELLAKQLATLRYRFQ